MLWVDFGRGMTQQLPKTSANIPFRLKVMLLFLSSRETKDYQGQGVSQENQGAPEEMCVVYNNIIIIDE